MGNIEFDPRLAKDKYGRAQIIISGTELFNSNPFFRVMEIEINGKTVETDTQGYLLDMDDWSEEFAAELAKRDGMELFADHWELMMYFREYYNENQTSPTMHKIVRTLGKTKGDHFHNQKAYEKHIYQLFPVDPIHEICKLAGLPMPQPDT